MKTLLLTLLTLPKLLLADAATTTTQPVEGGDFIAFPTPKPVSAAELKKGVQITEIGCMRTMLVFDKASLDVEKLVTQKLVDADFRVFGPYVSPTTTLQDPTACRNLGNDRKVDLVALVNVSSREVNKLGNFTLYEAEATVRVYSPVTAEIAVIHTSREKGHRHTDAREAERGAREKATALAAGEAIAKSLEKAHKILVHEAQIGGVQDRAHLEQIVAYLRDKKAFYNVREMLYDAKSQVAIIEMVGAPATESEWRQIVSQIPSRTVTKEVIHVNYIKNEVLRQKYPTWFRQE